jgi:RNA polymerase sigma-B factor
MTSTLVPQPPVYATSTPSPSSPSSTPDAAGTTSTRANRDELTARLLADAAGQSPDERSLTHDRVVRLNINLALSLASRYRARGIALEDLEQVALLGLVKAVRGFDPERGHEFLGYAIPTIKGEIRRHFRDSGWVVRPPRRIQELQSQVWAAEAELTQKLFRSPKVSELAEAISVDRDQIVEALSADGCFIPSSLDAPVVDGQGGTLGERQGYEDPGFDRSEARIMLGPVVRELDERDRKIIELRFFQGWTQQQIGEELGVTQMQISRLITRILNQLRAALEGSAA